MNKFVIAGGWSVSRTTVHDLHELGEVIGVNDAALWWVPKVDVAVTMDRLWFEHRWPLLKQRQVREVYVRTKCDCNVQRGDDDYWKTFTHWDRPGLTAESGVLHGANSGICAINLAYQRMGEGDKLFLFGFDMCKGPKGEAYWYPPYPWQREPTAHSKPGYYRDWAKEFDAIAESLTRRGIKTYSVNRHTVLKQFPIVNVKEMRAIINA